MRSTLASLIALAFLTAAMPQLVSAQMMAPMPPQMAGQPLQYGYWVPVVSPTPSVSSAAYGLRLSDDEQQTPRVPEVSCDVGCGCGSCVSRGCDSRGCDSRGGCCGRGFGGCSSCGTSGVFDQAFASIEYMSWYNKGYSLPPLATTSVGGTPQAAAGVLPGATILFGNNDVGDTRESGGRITFGWWLDDYHDLAIAAKVYGMDGTSDRFTRTAGAGSILAVPFFNSDPLVNAEDALLVAYPGLSVGTLSVGATTDVMGTEVFVRSMVDRGRNYRLDVLAGYQFNRIDSDLSISSQITQGVTQFYFNDVFDVENEFHAGVIGLYGEKYWDLLTFSAMGKLAMGNMNQQVAISGNNTVVNGGAVTTAGGLFTQPTNIGTFNRNQFVFAPEVNFKMSYAITQRLSVTVGYSFLYWTRVAMAGDQVDRAVNGSQLLGGPLVGPARPGVNFQDTDFWVQSVDVGVSYNF